MKILLIAIALTGIIIATSPTSVFAAQGQITEVNPSGVHGTITDIDTGDTYHLISRAEKGRPARIFASDETIEFVPFHNLAVLPNQEPDTNTGAN